jgi:hypothetical protein
MIYSDRQPTLWDLILEYWPVIIGVIIGTMALAVFIWESIRTDLT